MRVGDIEVIEISQARVMINPRTYGGFVRIGYLEDSNCEAPCCLPRPRFAY